jgi:hypothetical protein
VGKALDNVFLLSVAKCVLDLQHLDVANISFCYGCRCGNSN